jgi:hypothetical protein
MILSLTLISCANNDYDKIINKDYKKSQVKGIKNKKEENITYYKNDYRKKLWKEDIFLILKEENGNRKFYMGINYKGREWLYMNSVEFIGDDKLFIDFFDYKTFNPIWKDNTTLNMKVEEKILFPLDEKHLEVLEKIIKQKNVKVVLRSDYDERLHMRTLGENESIRMQEIFELHKKLKEEKERTEDGN